MEYRKPSNDRGAVDFLLVISTIFWNSGTIHGIKWNFFRRIRKYKDYPTIPVSATFFVFSKIFATRERIVLVLCSN